MNQECSPPKRSLLGRDYWDEPLAIVTRANGSRIGTGEHAYASGYFLTYTCALIRPPAGAVMSLIIFMLVTIGNFVLGYFTAIWLGWASLPSRK